MKRSIIAITIATMIASGAAMAGTVGLVNVQKVYNTSPMGQSRVNKDNKALNVKQHKLIKNMKSLEKTIRENQKSKNTPEKIKDVNAPLVVKLKAALKAYNKNLAEEAKVAELDAAAFNVKLRAAISSIAKQDKLETVLPSKVALYGGVDITDAVISKFKTK